MKKVLAILYVFILLLAIVAVSCSKGKNPVASSEEETYTVIGIIREGGSGLAGVLVRITGNGVDQTLITGQSGSWDFGNLGNGIYTITPSKSDYTFEPASATVTISGSDKTAETIIATKTGYGYTITGVIHEFDSGLVGVSVRITGNGVDQTVITDASGAYTFSGLASSTYTITPSKSGYTFNPTSVTVTVNGSSTTAGTIAATEAVNGYTVTGMIITGSSGSAGVSVHIIGSYADRAATTDANGSYVFSDLPNGTYTITPSKSGYTFNPEKVIVTVNGYDVTASTMVGTETVIGYSVYSEIHIGQYGIEGVTARITGNGIDRTAITNHTGQYRFSNIPNGTYTITPAKRDYFFNPPSQEVTVKDADTGTPVYFMAWYKTDVHTIKGTILEGSSGLAGVSVRIDVFYFLHWTVTTDVNGVYTFEGIPDGTYTITPSKIGYTFNPASIEVTVSEADKTLDHIYASRQ